MELLKPPVLVASQHSFGLPVLKHKQRLFWEGKGSACPKPEAGTSPQRQSLLIPRSSFGLFLCEKLSLLPWGWQGSGGGYTCGSPQLPVLVPNERDFGPEDNKSRIFCVSVSL